MRAAVTGGAGFIGSHLIEALLERGDEVVCVERPGAAKAWLEDEPIEWFPVGLAEPGALKDALRNVDVVFHLAGLTQARSAADYYAVNTEGTAHVLQAVAERETPPHVFLASSLAAIGPCRNGELLSSQTIPCPLSHYGLSKLFAESVAHSYAERIPITICRLSSVYGPRERAVLKMFQLVRRGVALTVGGWHREVSLIYVKDVVGALIAASRVAHTQGRTYCLAHPDAIEWADFADQVGKVVGRKPLLVSIPRFVAWQVARLSELIAALRRAAAILNRERVREIAQERWVCDTGELIADTGFRFAYPITRGVPETAAWYRKVGWL